MQTKFAPLQDGWLRSLTLLNYQSTTPACPGLYLSAARNIASLIGCHGVGTALVSPTLVAVHKAAPYVALRCLLAAMRSKVHYREISSGASGHRATGSHDALASSFLAIVENAVSADRLCNALFSCPPNFTQFGERHTAVRTTMPGHES